MSSAVLPEAKALPSATSPVVQAPWRHRGPTPSWWRDLTGATAWMLVLFVVGFWVAGGGLTAFGSPAESSPTSAGWPAWSPRS